MQVRAVALEERVRGERQEDVKIAGRPAAPARFALAGEPDTRAIFDTARNVDREHALAGQAAGARAGWTRVVDHLATAVTRRAGALEREETLGLANLAVARAARAGLRFRSGLGAAARASLAGHRGRNADLRGLAVERLFERDLHVVAQIRAALAPARAAAPAAHAEEVVEDIGERRGEIRTEAVRRAAAPAMLERGVAEAVVGGALLGVLEDVVGFADFLELVLAIIVAGIAVRMVFHRELAVRGLEVRVARPAHDAQHLVIVALGHHDLLIRLSGRSCPNLSRPSTLPSCATPNK